MILLHKCMYWLQRSFGPVKRFEVTPQGHYVVYLVLPGVQESDVSIRMTANNHIDVNSYVTKNIRVDNAIVQVPCYHHALITAPKGHTIETIKRKWQNGILIMTFDRECVRFKS